MKATADCSDRQIINVVVDTGSDVSPRVRNERASPFGERSRSVIPLPARRTDADVDERATVPHYHIGMNAGRPPNYQSFHPSIHFIVHEFLTDSLYLDAVVNTKSLTELILVCVHMGMRACQRVCILDNYTVLYTCVSVMLCMYDVVRKSLYVRMYACKYFLYVRVHASMYVA